MSREFTYIDDSLTDPVDSEWKSGLRRAYLSHQTIVNQTALVYICMEKEVFSENDIENYTQNEFEEYPEIYGWYAVNIGFADVLRTEGECILKNDFGIWWGRKTCNQLIENDGVIDSICMKKGLYDLFLKELEIRTLISRGQRGS